jgi:hypothetical protein
MDPTGLDWISGSFRGLVVGFFVLIPFLLFFDVSFFFYPSFCYELLIRLSSGTEFFALFCLGLTNICCSVSFFFFYSVRW